MAIFRWLLSGITCLFIGFSCSVLCGENPSASEPQVFDMNLRANQQLEVRNFELHNARPGDVLKARVVLTNLTEKPIEFVHANVSCKCTTAIIPKKILEPTKTEVLEFEFRVPKNPSTLVEHYSAMVEAKGGVRYLKFTFSLKLEDVCCFPLPEVSVLFQENVPRYSFKIPMLISDKALLRGSEIQVDDSLRSLESKVVFEKDQVFVAVEFPTASITDRQTTGEIRIMKSGKPIANTFCKILREKGVEIIPHRIVLTPSEDSADVRQGTAMLRMRSPSPNAVEFGVKALTCTKPDPEGPKNFDVEFKALGAEMYRIHIKLEKILLPSEGLLNWQIRTVAGDVFDLQSDYVLSK